MLIVLYWSIKVEVEVGAAIIKLYAIFDLGIRIRIFIIRNRQHKIWYIGSAELVELCEK